MRHNPDYAESDEAVVRDLIDANPWATIVSSGKEELVASHYPVLLDDTTDDLAIVSHVGRPDERLHALGTSEILLVVTGPHGYISPSWYSAQASPVPTWNFSVAHCYGVPEILSPEENLRVLTRLVDRFERDVESPVRLDQDLGAKLAQGTLGFRLPIKRFVCKLKLSQNQDGRSQAQVREALRQPGPYRNEALAADMERTLRLNESGR